MCALPGSDIMLCSYIPVIMEVDRDYVIEMRVFMDFRRFDTDDKFIIKE